MHQILHRRIRKRDVVETGGFSGFGQMRHVDERDAMMLIIVGEKRDNFVGELYAGMKDGHVPVLHPLEVPASKDEMGESDGGNAFARGHRRSSFAPGRRSRSA